MRRQFKFFLRCCTVCLFSWRLPGRCNKHKLGYICYPNIIWSSKKRQHRISPPDLGSGSINFGACGNGICPASMAFTVRCVLDLKSDCRPYKSSASTVQVLLTALHSVIGWSGGCQGSYDNNCYPYGLWSGSASSEILAVTITESCKLVLIM